jgi:hypothetical protein
MDFMNYTTTTTTTPITIYKHLGVRRQLRPPPFQGGVAGPARRERLVAQGAGLAIVAPAAVHAEQDKLEPALDADEHVAGAVALQQHDVAQGVLVPGDALRLGKLAGGGPRRAAGQDEAAAGRPSLRLSVVEVGELGRSRSGAARDHRL